MPNKYAKMWIYVCFFFWGGGREREEENKLFSSDSVKLIVQHVTRYSRKSLRVLGSVGEPINPSAWRFIICPQRFGFLYTCFFITNFNGSEMGINCVSIFLWCYQVVFQLGWRLKMPHFWHLVANRDWGLYGIIFIVALFCLTEASTTIHAMEFTTLLGRSLPCLVHGLKNQVLRPFLSLVSRYSNSDCLYSHIHIKHAYAY